MDLLVSVQAPDAESMSIVCGAARWYTDYVYFISVCLCCTTHRWDIGSDGNGGVGKYLVSVLHQEYEYEYSEWLDASLSTRLSRAISFQAQQLYDCARHVPLPYATQELFQVRASRTSTQRQYRCPAQSPCTHGTHQPPQKSNSPLNCSISIPNSTFSLKSLLPILVNTLLNVSNKFVL